MKYSILLVLILASLTLAQDSDRPDYKFPEGYNPDGRIGSLALTVFGGYTSQTEDWTGYHVNGRLDFPLDGSITLFVNLQHMSLSNNNSILVSFPDQTSTSFSVGFRIFGGMK
jgi:hypothetical protein